MDEVMLQTAWGWEIALYLFLGGLAAGTMLVSGIICLKDTDAKLHKTVRFGSWAALVCLGCGLLFLLLDVNVPLRAMMLWQSFSHFGSWMTIGAWLLVAGGVIGLLFALTNTDPITNKLGALVKARKPLAICGIVLGVCIAAYTGILLSVLEAHPLWNSVLLPVVFTVSAFDTGVALICGYAALRQDGSEGLRKKLEKATLLLVAIEVVALVALLALVAAGGEVGAASVKILIGGTLAPWFWLLFVAVGLAVPGVVAFLSGKKDSKAMTVAGCACCLIGGCALRFLILLAGIPVWMM